MTAANTDTYNPNAVRVSAGAKWLDEHHPGWVDKIDLESLDLNDCAECVLGQLFGDFHEAVERFDMVDLGYSRGFSCLVLSSNTRYHALTAEWRRLILERRAAR